MASYKEHTISETGGTNLVDNVQFEYSYKSVVVYMYYTLYLIQLNLSAVLCSGHIIEFKQLWELVFFFHQNS